MIRDKIELTKEVLDACDSRSRVLTDIVGRVRINSSSAKKILNMLMKRKFIVLTRTREIVSSEGIMMGDLRDRYLITDSGKMFLRDLNHVLEMLKDQ